jgi:hypothetical protein
MCLTLEFSPRRGLSSNHSATRIEKRLGEVTVDDLAEEEGGGVRNFIKHCGQIGRRATLLSFSYR